MSNILTSDVFTPAKLPTVTDVDRTLVSKQLARWVNRGGYFVSLLGTTKLGKTTLVKSFLGSLPKTSWSVYVPGQALGGGASHLWIKLAQALQIPTSKETGLANSSKDSWGFIGRLSVAILPTVAKASINSSVSCEDSSTSTAGETFDIDPEQAVTEALMLLRANNRKVVIAIDDFHFVTETAARRAIVLALRPLADVGCAIVLSTIPGGELDPEFETTNTGGRRKTVLVPRWDPEELEQIAIQGMKALNLWAPPELIAQLAGESFGSPQIMQQLCLDLVEVENGYESRDDADQQEEVKPPATDAFYRSLEDDEATSWLAKLSAGPNPRKKRKKREYPTEAQALFLDGYQLIMQTLHAFGSPHELPLSDLKRHVGETLDVDSKELNKIALELKARNLGLLASKAIATALEQIPDAALEEFTDDETNEDQSAFAELVAGEAIPQPVFEVRGSDIQATIRILDPLVSYMIKWRPEIIVSAGRP